jgi:hypothetical protein
MDATQPDNELPANDLLVSGDVIKTFLKSLGMPETVDPYYLKRTGWPIGKSGSGQSAKLVASKRRLIRYAQKIAAPQKTTEAAAIET